MKTIQRTKYAGIVIKSGNSYAIRVPKDYVVENNLQEGQRVALDELPVMEIKPFDATAMEQAIASLKQLNPYPELKTIKDIVEWQRENRRDKPMLGRDYGYDEEL